MSLVNFLKMHRSKFPIEPYNIESVEKLFSLIKESDIDIPKTKNEDKNKTSDSTIKIKKFIDENYLNPQTNSELNEAFFYLTHFIPTEYGFSDKEIEDNFTSLKDQFDIKFSYSSRSIEFLMEAEMYFPEEDVSFNFGKFNIKMLESKVVCYPHSDNHEKDFCVHPYISTDGNYKLCLGDFLEPYKSFWKQRDFIECFMAVREVLTVFGGNEGGVAGRPHQGINFWIGAQCSECLEHFDIETMEGCSVLPNVNICQECAKNLKCEYTNKIYSSHLLDNCDECGKQTTGIRKNKKDSKNKKKICVHCRKRKAQK